MPVRKEHVQLLYLTSLGGASMKDLNELNFPENLRYDKEHEWVITEDGKVKIGLSDYAQDQLGEIVFCELPEIGDSFKKGAEFGTVESVKSVSELYMPIGGKVVAVNEELEETAELINNQPYEEGWLILVEPSDAGEIESLLTRDAYIDYLKGLV
jgi:glycine cleavage system H protein